MTTHTVRIFNERGDMVFSTTCYGLADARNTLVSRGYEYRYKRARDRQWIYEKAAVPLGPRFTIPAERGVIEELDW